MNADRHFEEEDLALYAMRLLAEPEDSAVAREVAENAQTRSRLAEVQAKLAAYGQASVDLLPVPETSLQRFMESIERERKVAVLPYPEQRRVLPAQGRQQVWGKLLPWTGWAIAAVLALSVGKLYRDRADAQRRTGDREIAMLRDKDSLQARLDAQMSDNARLLSQASSAQNAVAGLRKTVNGQAATLDATTQTAASAEQERDALRGTVAAQANQVAQMADNDAAAQKLLAALRNPAALQVSLTRPKTKPAPQARASYLASSGTLVFLASNLAPLRTDKIYELWLMPSDGSSPVPAGTFQPDSSGNASLIYARFPRAVPAKGFSVTIENAGGSETPTLPLILTGL